MADVTVMKSDATASSPATSYASYTITASSSVWRALTLDGRYQWYVMHNGLRTDLSTVDNSPIIFSQAQTVAIDGTEQADKVVLLGGTVIYRALPLPRIESSADNIWNFKSTGTPTFQLLRGAYLLDGSGEGT